LVMEFIGTIRQSAPHKRGDRVDHHPESVFGALHLVDSSLKFLYRMAPLEYTRALAGDGRFRTGPLPRHTMSNLEFLLATN
jgi:hypothetical protein